MNLFLMPITGSEPVHLRTLTAIGKTLIIVGIIDLLVKAGSGKELMSILFEIRNNATGNAVKKGNN